MGRPASGSRGRHARCKRHACAIPGLKELILAHGGRGGVEVGPEVRSEGRGEGGVGAGLRVGLDDGFAEDEG